MGLFCTTAARQSEEKVMPNALTKQAAANPLVRVRAATPIAKPSANKPGTWSAPLKNACIHHESGLDAVPSARSRHEALVAALRRALNALLLAWAYTGREDIGHWYEKVHQYSFERFADPGVRRVVRLPQPRRQPQCGPPRPTAGRAASTCRAFCSAVTACCKALRRNRTDTRTMSNRSAATPSMPRSASSKRSRVPTIFGSTTRWFRRWPSAMERRTSSARRARRGPSPAATRR